ncbi:MAG: DNA/RNA non-specific endonuclease [Maribacter sp.]|uniref:DNA/RNA non-specific endonuclease n=1 Tax=Maribacter sp. TaxID=1897614 RepID=UPI003296CB99
MKLFSNASVAVLTSALVLLSCSQQDDLLIDNSLAIADNELTISGKIDVPTHFYDNHGVHKHKNTKTSKASGFIETFESAVKGSYAAGTIDLTATTGIWFLDDALAGSLANDRKYGNKSIRIRNTGTLLMDFDMDNGAESISIRHAVYGTNGNSTWKLVLSYDQGVTWYDVGATVTSNQTTLNTVTFDVNDTQPVRYGVVKLTGGSNRINIDNVEIVVSSAGNDPTTDSNITFGNPSDAASDANNYFLDKPDFSLSYNNSDGTANWVSWHLSSAWLGDVPRCNCFRTDQDLPSSFYKAAKSHYTNSGFDRGHLCASADRNGTEDSNRNTYYMTNVAPQAPDNNRRSWAYFENYLRSLTDEGMELYIVAGVVGTGGTGSNGAANTINNGKINVPDSFWKVALILPNGGNDIGRVTTSTRVIAINVPNDQAISTDWAQFITTVDDIENLTGYDLFENIPDGIEAVIEAVTDGGPSI